MSRDKRLGIMEDPVKGIIVEALYDITSNYVVKNISIEWSSRELRIKITMKPLKEDATLSTWKLVELEDRIVALLGIEYELSHSRIGVTPGGDLLLIYSFRITPRVEQRGKSRE